jgi:hypothetical protein
MMEVALVWLLTTASLLIGYGLGRQMSLEQPLGQLKAKLKPKATTIKVGKVTKPTALEIAKKGTIREETEKAIEETYWKEMNG